MSSARALEIAAEEWTRRLTVKVEPQEDNEAPARGRRPATRARRSKDEVKRETEPASSAASAAGDVPHGKKAKSGKLRKEERLLTPSDAPLYTPALAASQLPLGASEVVKGDETSFSASQLQLMDLTAEKASGLWRLHARSGVRYRKGPFTREEKLIVEEALQQYAQREGLASVEEAVKSLSGNVGKRNCGRFHCIARCLPERPLVSVYGYIRRRICGSVKRGPWSEDETRELLQLVKRFPQGKRGKWVQIGAALNRRPADVCDKWRLLQPRVSELGAAAEGGAGQAASSSSSPAALQDAQTPQQQQETPESAAGGSVSRRCMRFGAAEKERLLLAVQQETGEELPSFGVPWRRIQAKSFPLFSHALLRRVFSVEIVPAELRRRMGVAPRPVILRHVLRCLGRLEGPLPGGLRGIEWLEILPFVPSNLQREVLRAAAGPCEKEEGVHALETAIPALLQQHRVSLEATRRSDAALLLRGALPVEVQQALEARVVAKAAARGWSSSEVRRRVRRRLRRAAAKELQRLKCRLRDVRATPLNAPPRGGRTQQVQQLKDEGLPQEELETDTLWGASSSCGTDKLRDEEEDEANQLLLMPFTGGAAALGKRLNNKKSNKNHQQEEEGREEPSSNSSSGEEESDSRRGAAVEAGGRKKAIAGTAREAREAETEAEEPRTRRRKRRRDACSSSNNEGAESCSSSRRKEVAAECLEAAAGVYEDERRKKDKRRKRRVEGPSTDD